MTTDRVAALLDDLAAKLAEVERVVEGESVAYVVQGATFAYRTGGSAAFRLKPDIAAAALRTPDTRPSERGPDWIVFGPAGSLDRFSLDRLASWFEMAFRLAAGR